MTFRRWKTFILGLAGLAVPGWGSLSFTVGDSSNNTLNTAISAWSTASGFSYLVQESTFLGSLSGAPAVYIDPSSGSLFEGFNLTSGANGTQDSLAISGAALQQTASGGIIEITNLPANLFALAAEFQVVPFASPNGFCIQVNSLSFTQNCDDVFAMGSTSDTVFVGIVSTGTPISTLWIGPSINQNEKLQINNFDIQGSAAPEGSTLLLLGGGLILIGAVHRRRVAVRSE